MRKIWITTLALVVASVACSLGGGVPTPPASPIPVSSEAAGQLEQVWATAVAGSQDGQISVVITEQQLTSFFALKTAENPESLIKEPQVFLRDGKMLIYANATVRGVTAPVEITLSAAPNPDGLLTIDIEKASFGPLPMPAALRDSVSGSINELITGQIGSEGTGVKITAIAIADGQMVITGTLTR